MARNICFLLVLLACGSCMEMRETVERMVMVRTTGSDLQPAATGYIYKKEPNGPARVVKMGKSEVMKHLSKIYEKPEAYKAPVPAATGPFHDKEAETKPAASYASEAYVIPDEEKSQDEDKIPGIASEDYGKIFGRYGLDFGDKYKDFSDYLYGAADFHQGANHEHGGGKDYGLKNHHVYGDKGYKGYAKSHKYGKGGAGDYHTEKYESFSVSGGKGHEKHYDGADDQGKDYEGGHNYKTGDHGYKSTYSKGEALDGYHKIFDKDEHKKDNDFYDGEKYEGDFYKHGDGHTHHRSETGAIEKGGAHDSGYHRADAGNKGYVDKESGDQHEAGHSGEESGESSHHKHGDFGDKSEEYAGKSYGYEVKHR